MVISLNELIEHYSKVRPLIEKRMKEFEEVGKSGSEEIFRELCFCLLTAGASAELGIKTINHLGDTVFVGSKEDVVCKLKECYRFYNIRGNFIFLARESFKPEFLKLDFISRRDEIVKNVKGIGYKEASHFLRNIGFKGYAILDKHVISLLFELAVLSSGKPPKNRKEYLEIEAKMKDFSKKVGIDFDHLDLVLWSYKTGKVLK